MHKDCLKTHHTKAFLGHCYFSCDKPHVLDLILRLGFLNLDKIGREMESKLLQVQSEISMICYDLCICVICWSIVF